MTSTPNQPTQVEHPWRAVIRTAFAVLVALAAGAPLLYTAATQQSVEAATGAVGTVLAVSAAITRVMATPFVDTFIRTYLPWLRASSDGEGAPVAEE